MLYTFDRKQFFTGFRSLHKGLTTKLFTQAHVEALNFLLTQIEQDDIWQSLEHIGYALATVTVETAYTYSPIDEYGGAVYFERRYGWQTRVGQRLGNDAAGEGAKYHGRGDVQLTGETNYERLELDLRKHYPALIAAFEERTGQTFDLTDNPNQAKDAAIAYAIMAFGMYHGRFTGKSFDTYTRNGFFNAVSARGIINGNDRAQEIAGIAKSITNILKASLVTGSAPVEELPAPVNLSTPVELPLQEAAQSPHKSAFDVITSYAQVTGKALGITSVGGVVSAVIAKLTGANIPPEYITYGLVALVVLIVLIVLFGGAALICYVIGRFILTAIRETHANKLNLAQAEAMANNSKQAFTFVSASGV